MAIILPFSNRTAALLQAMPGAGGTHRWMARIAAGLAVSCDREGTFTILRVCCDRFVSHRSIPDREIEQAVSQSIRNQNDDHIPKLFTYTQMVLALNKNSAKYATTGTAAKFWSVWKELRLDSEGREFGQLQEIVNKPLHKDILFSLTHSLDVKPTLQDADRLVTEQDKTLYALCRPERLLELAWKFTVFDGGLKKIAFLQKREAMRVPLVTPWRK